MCSDGVGGVGGGEDLEAVGRVWEGLARGARTGLPSSYWHTTMDLMSYSIKQLQKLERYATSIIIRQLSVNARKEFGDHFRTKLKIKESVSTKERLAFESLPDMSFIFTQRKGPNSTRVLTVQGFTEIFGEEGSGKTPYLRTCPRLSWVGWCVRGVGGALSRSVVDTRPIDNKNDSCSSS